MFKQSREGLLELEGSQKNKNDLWREGRKPSSCLEDHYSRASWVQRAYISTRILLKYKFWFWSNRFAVRPKSLQRPDLEQESSKCHLGNTKSVQVSRSCPHCQGSTFTSLFQGDLCRVFMHMHTHTHRLLWECCHRQWRPGHLVIQTWKIRA